MRDTIGIKRLAWRGSNNSVNTFKYKAFISYCHVDSECAEWLLKSLESYKIPPNLVGRVTEHGPIPERLAPIFRDRDELPAAGRMTERLFDALQTSEFLIVLCSPNAAQSKLVNREIAEFKSKRDDGHILGLIIDGTPFSDDPSQECFPDALQHSFHTDGVKAGLSAEGLAADIRPEADGKRMGLMKIIAGMLGVGLNDLVQREEKRRQRRLAVWSTAAGISLFAMGCLTYEAMSARTDAEQATKIAEAKTIEAEQRLTENEQLTHFMMTNIYEELLTIGSLDSLEVITNEILDYYQKRNFGALSEKQIFSLTGARLRLGQMLDRRGDSVRAEQIFEETLKLSRDFYARQPDSGFALFRLSNNLFFTGYLAHRQGRLDRAEADYRERLKLVNSGKDMPPPFVRADFKPHWQEDPKIFWWEKIADSEAALTTLLAGARRQPEQAIEYGKSSVAMREVLAARSNQNKQSFISLGGSYQYLGAAYLRAGLLEEAADNYAKRLAIFEQLIAKEPNNYRVRRRLFFSQANIAELHSIRGDIASAVQIYAGITAGFDGLVAKDPKNTLWLSDSAQAYERYGALALQTGQVSVAETAAQKARSQIDISLERDNTRPARRLASHRVRLLEARLSHGQGESNLAQSILLDLAAAYQIENEAFKLINGAYSHISEVHLFLGDLTAKGRSGEPAHDQWKTVVDILTRANGTISLTAKGNLATAYQRLGQPEKAQPLIAELEKTGFIYDRPPPIR